MTCCCSWTSNTWPADHRLVVALSSSLSVRPDWARPGAAASRSRSATDGIRLAAMSFEDLEHLGPFLQGRDAELGIAHRLLDQVFTGSDQARELAAVGPLCHRLVLDPPAILEAVELFRR